MALFYNQFIELFSENTEYTINVNPNHPFLAAERKINWDTLVEEITPIVYRGIYKYIGRYLDIRAHCGIYLLQSVHNWTDRQSEDMLSYHAPTRIFCGLENSLKKGIDHTRIEKFRNKRLGREGAEILNKYLLLLGKKQGYTDGKDIDMDTTVQESGITYPTELKLMKKFQERTKKIIEKAVGTMSAEAEKIKEKLIETRQLIKEYQFFTKIKEKKKDIIAKVREISLDILKDLQGIAEVKKEEVKILKPALKKELAHLLSIMPKLLEQIKYWLRTGIIAGGKIISLYKAAPHFIRKGKIGKTAEIGRKVIINQYTGGFLSAVIPDNPIISDYDCVGPSLINAIKIFSETPESYGTDRGMYSQANISLCRDWRIKNIGIQPKGTKEWEVDQEMARKLYCRRAGIEPRIGIAGQLGLKKSRAKSDEGDIITAHRAVTGFNLKKLMTLWAQ